VSENKSALSYRVTPYFASLASPDDDDPIGRQFRVNSAEERVLPYELQDPLGEESYTPVPRLVHRYPNRALLLVTDRCAVHCRYCFRKNFSGSGLGPVVPEELRAVAAYLEGHPEIDELLLSGGDPLTLSDGELEALIAAVRAVRPDIILRVCTRAPGVQPSRIDASLCRLLKETPPVWIVAQFNHPAELSAESRNALSLFIDHGIPVVSQTVLLRGVNDAPGILAELFEELLRCRVKPYYLFQPDLVPGTSHFRPPLRRSLEIVRELRGKISRLAAPVFAVDIPGGGGKVTLGEEEPPKDDEGWYILTGPDGLKGRYPDEERLHGRV